MKTILQNIQNKLAEVPELKYIDEDWGQLNMNTLIKSLAWIHKLDVLTLCDYKPKPDDVLLNVLDFDTHSYDLHCFRWKSDTNLTSRELKDKMYMIFDKLDFLSIHLYHLKAAYLKNLNLR